MAVANVNNVERAKKFMAKATEKAGKASPREKKYLDAWKAFYDKAEVKKEEPKKEEGGEGERSRPAPAAPVDNANVARRKALVSALEDIAYEYPDDLEAKALLVSQLWENNGKGVPILSYLAIDALIKDVLSVNPEH